MRVFLLVLFGACYAAALWTLAVFLRLLQTNLWQYDAAPDTIILIKPDDSILLHGRSFLSAGQTVGFADGLTTPKSHVE